MTELLPLFPSIDPYTTGFLDVDSTHSLYWEESGNPDGEPIVLLHGGPGAGAGPVHRRFFDPAHYRIVIFDQRGAGRSKPHGSVESNTLDFLVQDIETLRAHLNIEAWHVFGGSWGSTLALAYAAAHPKSCLSLILRGIFLFEQEEIDWFLYGIRAIFPDQWEIFSGHIPPEERVDLLDAYMRRLFSDDPQTRLDAAKIWNHYESACATLLPNDSPEDPMKALSLARLEAHYFKNGVLAPEKSLLNRIDSFRHIPAVIVQGRYDVICPIQTAWKLHRLWPEAELVIVPDAGHSSLDPGIRSRLIQATENAKTRQGGRVTMDYTTLKDFPCSGKAVLLRADLNVPTEDGQVTDFTRIDRLKPTIDHLRAQNAKIVLLSHFGRPKGERNPEMSLEFLAPVLAQRWGLPVSFASDCIGDPAKSAIGSLQPGNAVLLENLRFHKGEEKNDPAFTRELACLGDLYVNDAFSAAHRAHASTEGLAHILPTAAGFLMEAELEALGNALESPQRPVAAIVGGAKISSKLELLGNLVQKTDMLVLGGGMANTFLYAQGYEVGQSLCEKDMAEQARSIMATAEKCGCEIVLPADRVIVKEFGKNVPHDICASASIPADREAVDIGPETIRQVSEKLASCKTVVWNGPMGVFEVPPFDNGTNGLARAVADLTKAGKVLSVAGGGDTVAALEKAGVAGEFSYVSTAGGAFLEWLEGKTLPGVAALTSRKNAA